MDPSSSSKPATATPRDIIQAILSRRLKEFTIAELGYNPMTSSSAATVISRAGIIGKRDVEPGNRDKKKLWHVLVPFETIEKMDLEGMFEKSEKKKRERESKFFDKKEKVLKREEMGDVASFDASTLISSGSQINNITISSSLHAVPAFEEDITYDDFSHSNATSSIFPDKDEKSSHHSSTSQSVNTSINTNGVPLLATARPFSITPTNIIPLAPAASVMHPCTTSFFVRSKNNKSTNYLSRLSATNFEPSTPMLNEMEQDIQSLDTFIESLKKQIEFAVEEKMNICKLRDRALKIEKVEVVPEEEHQPRQNGYHDEDERNMVDEIFQ